MFKSMAGFQGPPHLHSGDGVWGKPDLRPTLACFQMKSKDTSVEEWKGSETYSPNTAYGKTPALTPASRGPMSAMASWPDNLSPCHLLFPPGTDFLVPVMGYVCRICHKFYHSNSGAQLAHCKSLAHFENLQVSWASCPGLRLHLS